MPEPLAHLKPTLAATLLLLSPVAAVMIALVALEAIGVTAAFIAFAAIGASIAALVRPHVRGVARMTAQLDAIADEMEAPLPSPAWPPLVVALASAVGRVKRRTQVRREDLAARIAALDAVLDSLPDPLVMLDNRLRVVRANRAARALMTEDPVGRELSVTLRVPALIEAAQSSLRRGAGARVAFEHGGPVKRSFVGNVERLGGLTRDDVSLVIALHDLTAEKRTEQMRADFVANASHELRTPLATLLGFIETLQGPASEDGRTRERFLGIMREQASRMSRLVDDLLSLSRIELREHNAPTTEVDLPSVLHGVADALQPQCRARDMNLVLEPPAEPLQPALGDAEELTQVFQNLIDNALKYGRHGSKVEVTVERATRGPASLSRLPPGGLVAIAVRDQGEGIPRDQIPRLTERFYRVDAARSRELGGTGLGLAIVKHIVSRHRGALQIESEIGQGSTFTVYLPLADRNGAKSP